MDVFKLSKRVDGIVSGFACHALKYRYIQYIFLILTADAFLLVFSYNNRDSFEQICQLRESILKLNRKEPKMVVVGNKGDLLEESPERCAITRELAESLAVLDWEVRTKMFRLYTTLPAPYPHYPYSY